MDRDVRCFFGVTDTVCIPFCNSDTQLRGTISFDALYKERKWSKVKIKRLALAAEVFGNALVQKRAFVLLKQSNQRLEPTAESAGARLSELDLAIGTYWATSQAKALFGYPPDQAVTQAQSRQPQSAPVVKTLPDGYVPVTVDNVKYQDCVGTFYRTAFQGNNLVYVVTNRPL